MALIHDRLLHYDPVQNQLVPGLARTYEVSPDGLTWTFHLRDAQTPDGTPLRRTRTSSSPSTSASTPDSTARAAATSSSKEAHRGDGHRSCSRSRFAWPSRFTPSPGPSRKSSSYRPRPSLASPKDEKDFRQAVGVQQPELQYLRGFGPYFVESRDTQEVTLVRNDHFWGRGDDQAPRPTCTRSR